MGMSSTLTKKDVKKGMIWSGIEIYAGQVLQLITGVIMARLLMPSDYGVLSMLALFMCIARITAEGGYYAAILRNKDITQSHLSTIFTVNTVVSLLLIGLFWVTAPLIADFFKTPILIDVTRWLSLTVLFSGIRSVSETLLRKQLRFKLLAKLTLSSALIADAVSIVFAMYDYNVWALVIQTLLTSGLYTLMVIYFAGWRPRFGFSYQALKSIFNFSNKILGSNVIIQIYQNIYFPIVGRFFTSSILGFFTRADAYSRRINVCVVGMLQKTMLPMISRIQDDREALIKFNRRTVCIASFFVFPIALTLAGVAYPVMQIVFTDKWLGTAPMLQILCLCVLPDLIFYINNDFFTVKGCSGALMRIQVYRIILIIAALACTVPFGITAVVWGKVVSSLLSWIVSAYYLKRIMHISIWQTLSDVWLIFILSVIIGGLNLLAFAYLEYTIINLVATLLLSAGIYIGAVWIIKPSLLRLVKG
jgi:O-antigen/teichoic acid export membrane protein